MQGDYAASKHTLASPINELDDQFGPIEYLVISRQTPGDTPRFLYYSALAGRFANAGRPSPFSITVSKFNLLEPVRRQLGELKEIDIYSVYDQFTTSVARTLLTGHYLGTKHKKLFDAWAKSKKSKAEFVDATDAYWAPLIDEAGGVTRLTVQIYQELLACGEGSSPSLISVLMNTGPRTVHTRLQEARKLGLLDKPGGGVRK
ncbi:hypothetical protein MCEMZLE2_01415 [Candidatus Nanopelagicaceae bacterium]